MGTDGTSHVGISVCNLERHYVGKFGDNFVGNFERNYLGHFGRNYVGNLGRGYVNNFRKDCAVAGCRPRRERCVARACSLANCARAAAQREHCRPDGLGYHGKLGQGQPCDRGGIEKKQKHNPGKNKKPQIEDDDSENVGEPADSRATKRSRACEKGLLPCPSVKNTDPIHYLNAVIYTSVPAASWRVKKIGERTDKKFCFKKSRAQAWKEVLEHVQSQCA